MLLSLLLYQDEEISASAKKNIVKSLFFVIKQSY